MRIILFVFIVLTITISAYGRELYPGQYAQVDPAERQWFRNQKSPKNGGSCCSEADGTYAEEDIRDGHYWTRFTAYGKQYDWMQVPDDVVIREPNRHGAPVVWFYFEDGTAKIRCYAPGALM